MKKKVPQCVMEAISHVLCYDMEGEIRPKMTHQREVKAVVDQEKAIRPEFLVRGFIAVGWYEVLWTMGVLAPERKMTEIQKILWFEVFKKIWGARNDILHHSKNFYRDRESKDLGWKIRWFVEHRHEVAKNCDQFMLEIDLTRLDRCRLRTRRR